MGIYLDNAATTSVCGEAAQKALEIMTLIYGNPSSTHLMGRQAKNELDTARACIAAALGADASEIFFTSGGTESNNWAILNGVKSVSRQGNHIITAYSEHDAVRKSFDALESMGFEVSRLSPDSSGAISPEGFKAALRDDTVFVSLMLVNNETGAITDISEISKLLKAQNPKALLHTDAVQGFLKIPFSPKSLGADLLSVSGHKIHAPKGVGALYIKSGLRLSPMLLGGGQESGIRAGTEALPQIAAFGVAACLCKKNIQASIAHMNSLRAHAVSRLNAENPGLIVIGGGAPHILSISLPGHKSETIMNFLESRDIYISKSSACKKGRRSHVLESMGLKNDVIDGALRIGLSRYNTFEEIDIFCDGLADARNSILTALR